MEGLVGEAMQLMVNALGQAEGEGHDIAKSYEIENSINNLRNDLCSCCVCEIMFLQY